jgi:hypothetical protein
VEKIVIKLKKYFFKDVLILHFKFPTKTLFFTTVSGSARCLLYFKSFNDKTLFRIIRCLEADASKPPAERTFPVFVVVATKFRQLAGTRPVLELCLSSEGTIAYNPFSRVELMFLGLPDPDPLVRDTDPDPIIIKP